MAKLLFEILFFAAMTILGIFSLIMIYVLLRFGKSKSLGLILSALYLLLMISLFAAAVANLNAIPYAQI